jgi:hypothetical protein
MSGLFHRLASRALGHAATAEPLVPSVFAPVAHNGPVEMAAERTEVGIRPANASPTLPSIQTGPAEEAVREIFEQHHTRNGEPNRSIDPPIARSIEPGQTQATTPAPMRSLPQLLNPTVPRQDVLDRPANHMVPQLPAQSIPTAASPTPIPPRAARRETEQPDSSLANLIRVSIGRIDVRAELPAPIQAPAPRQRPSGMSLDEYAKLRAEGKR